MIRRLAVPDSGRAGRGSRPLRALAGLILVLVLAALVPSSALAGPTFGPVGADSGNFSCGGGGAVGLGGYTARWTTDTDVNSRCDWNMPSRGAGTRVATMSFNWSTSLGPGNSNARYIQFGVVGGSGMQSKLWGSTANTPFGWYAFDVAFQDVAVAATRHLATARPGNYGQNPAVVLGETVTAGLQYVYEDTYPPTVNSMSVYPGTSYGGWFTSPPLFNFQTSDNAYFNNDTHISVEGGGLIPYSGGCAPFQGSPCYTTLNGVVVDPGPDGVNKIARVTRYANGGWGNAQEVRTFNSDRFAPTSPGLSATGYSSGAWTNQPVTVSVTTPSHDNVYGTGSGVASYSWSYGQTGGSTSYSADGSYFVQARANDNAGHQSDWSPNFVVNIDTIAPPAPAISGAPAGGSWSNTPGGVALTIGPVTDVGAPASSGVDPTTGYQYRYRTSADGVGYGAWTAWATGPNPVIDHDGWTEIAARAVDRAGNYSAETTETIRYDGTPPNTPSLVSDEDWHCAASQTVTAAGSSDPLPGSGGLTYQYRIQAPGDSSFGAWQEGASVVVSAEGETVVQFRALDAAGNASTPVSTTVRLDCGLPSDVTITGGSLSWQSTASVTLTASATDAVSGVQHYRWQRSTDGGATWVDLLGDQASQLFSDEGESLLRAKAVDRAGNESPNWAPLGHRSDPITPSAGATVRIDRTPPEAVSLEWAYRAQDEGAETVSDRVSATDPGWQRVGYDQPLWPAQAGEPEPPQADFGPITLRIALATPDAVSGLHPSAPYDVAQPIGDSCPGITEPSWVTWGNLAQLPHVDRGEDQGRFLVCFRARDAAGNLSEVASGLIRADRTAPATPFVTTTAGSWQQGRTARVTVAMQPEGAACADAHDPYCDATPQDATGVAGVVAYEFQKTTGSDWGAPSSIPTMPGTFYVTAGEWQVRARTVDGAGNRSAWSAPASVLLADANTTLVRSWGIGSIESALCRLPSVRGAVDLEDCGASVGGPDWNPRHIWTWTPPAAD